MKAGTTALDVLAAGTGLMPWMMFETPMDVVSAGAGYGNPVKDSRILKNGKSHRIALLWFNGNKPTITGFHRSDRKIKYLLVEQKIYKGPNRGRTFVTATVPVVHWRQFKHRAVPRVMLWGTSESTLRKIKGFGKIEFMLHLARKGQYSKYELQNPDGMMLPYVVSLYGRRVFTDAENLLLDLKKNPRTKRWEIREM